MDRIGSLLLCEEFVVGLHSRDIPQVQIPKDHISPNAFISAVCKWVEGHWAFDACLMFQSDCTDCAFKHIKVVAPFNVNVCVKKIFQQ